jgi:hypothetical protein
MTDRSQIVVELAACYHYIKVARPELEKSYDHAAKKVVDGEAVSIPKDYYQAYARSLHIQYCQSVLRNAQKKLDKNDTELLTWVETHRDLLRT